jgi:hypothetical protein
MSTNFIFPYNPGPLNSPPLLKVNISCYSQLYSLDNLCGNQSHIILKSKIHLVLLGFSIVKQVNKANVSTLSLPTNCLLKYPYQSCPHSIWAPLSFNSRHGNNYYFVSESFFKARLFLPRVIFHPLTALLTACIVELLN